MDIVNVKNVCKDYYQYRVFVRGKLLTQALKNVSFTVKKGDFFGLLGKNGAGKSTLLKILTTNLEKSGGKVYVNGYDMDKDENKIKESISWMFGVDYDGVGWSSVEKNLLLAASFLGLKKGEAEERVKELLHQFGLYKHRKLDVWRMSTGMQGRYSLCVAMLKNPEVLFLDEPLLGLDFEAKEQLRGLLKTLNEDGTTIIYTDQQLQEVEKLCKNVVVIDQGSKVYEGSMSRLKEMYRDADVVELRCRSLSILPLLRELKKKFSFITDYELVESKDNIHEVKLFTSVDGAEVLMKIGNFLHQKRVMVEKLNAGTLGLEDVFIKFLQKDKHREKAKQLLNYQKTGEKPSKEDMRYLHDKHPLVRGAACRAFADYHHVERVLKDMLSLTKEMKIESLRIIGDRKLKHLAEHIKKEIRAKDEDLHLHIALAMGKIGDVNVVDTLMALLLDYRTCFEVLDHVPRLDQDVLQALREKIHALRRLDLQFLLYQIKKMKNSKELLDILHVRENESKPLFGRRAAYLARYGKQSNKN